MMILFYTLCIRLAVPVLLLRLLWRSPRNPAYRYKLFERLGYRLLNKPESRASEGDQWIWVHAVSVGETLAVAPLIEKLLNADPKRQVVVTSTTPTGRAQVERLFDKRVSCCWVPFDTPGSVARFLAHWRPSLTVLVETEIWPNIVLQCKRHKIPVMLANARLSSRSARGYARAGLLAKPVIASLALIACQQKADARRFIALGADSHKTLVTGSMKFDIARSRVIRQRDSLLEQLAMGSDRLIFLAGSTHHGEEELVVAAFTQLRKNAPSALLVLAPRHPERTASITRSILAPSPFHWLLRSTGQVVSADTDILVLDTLGELAALTAAADVSFIGGSLVPHGGHNPLEAAAFGVPVITGPHTFNFLQIFRALRRVGGAIEVTDAATLGQAVGELLTQVAYRREVGNAASRYVEENQGALVRQHALIDQLLSD
jgi:3-deoxy-D-manno-octulosonic-acid transferase